MKYLEIESHNGKVLTVDAIDRDQEVQIDIKDHNENTWVAIYLTRYEVQELIDFLQNQIKDL